ncbi:hypothetical protein KS4_20120 [Poriferisphaera corsica]|uniref:Uncharacterized protein n=1 Tax=Poriferisphaera corsica TaxID=2528020 RepID=A0A517YUX0_9BACT|nr:hypothetical protein KS4_20120 [Poriferisphaera corsica]
MNIFHDEDSPRWAIELLHDFIKKFALGLSSTFCLRGISLCLVLRDVLLVCLFFSPMVAAIVIEYAQNPRSKTIDFLQGCNFFDDGDPRFLHDVMREVFVTGDLECVLKKLLVPAFDELGH